MQTSLSVVKILHYRQAFFGKLFFWAYIQISLLFFRIVFSFLTKRLYLVSKDFCNFSFGTIS